MKLPIILLLILSFTFATFAQKNVKPVAENFSGTATNGKTIELQALKGKVVLLSFWSTKCQICHVEIPKLNKIVELYKNKDVIFIGLTMNNEAMVNSYIKDNPFNFDILPNSFGVVLKYAEKDSSGRINMGFPAHFLINQNGEIELKTSGFDKTEKLKVEINRLLAENKSAKN